ncbi:hypothetical protein K503DRAFT_772252 [Rhizopogon vinicolor AM-OR11-026]|uniref:Uncharacterized protein n=1 Tax=Rhizopogon vinicolor AM-OR11-026 TaxID=1314800 RepID=A0A1B7MVU8_9AGAM|nr:hypothetical protein K503DRAFT_772252 [Rhizopogon vinicolor AM-OR11-026]
MCLKYLSARSLSTFKDRLHYSVASIAYEPHYARCLLSVPTSTAPSSAPPTTYFVSGGIQVMTLTRMSTPLYVDADVQASKYCNGEKY